MSKQVLIVEDEFDGQKVVSKILGFMNLNSDVVDTAEDAIQKLQDSAYDAIIIDLALPGMDGMQLLTQIRSNVEYDNVPCIVMTAYHSSQVKSDALAAGCNAYFAKPFDEMLFIREIERFVK